jgi:predicted Zn-dependent protease
MVLCALLAGQVSGALARQRPIERDAGELALFPSGRLLTEASLGHARLTADLAWLAAIQYYGRHRQSDRRYPLAGHLLRVVTDADPGFRNAYLFGALVLAENGEPAQAAALLRKGAFANPESWRLWFELGFCHYVVTRDYAEAARALRIAARLAGAPDYAARFAAAATDRGGDPQTAARLWETIARESDNEEIRRMALDHVRDASPPR